MGSAFIATTMSATFLDILEWKYLCPRDNKIFQSLEATSFWISLICVDNKVIFYLFGICYFKTKACFIFHDSCCFANRNLHKCPGCSGRNFTRTKILLRSHNVAFATAAYFLINSHNIFCKLTRYIDGIRLTHLTNLHQYVALNIPYWILCFLRKFLSNVVCQLASDFNLYRR